MNTIISQSEGKSEISKLNKLKDKLLDLSSRSRKIKFSLTKWLSWDLTELTSKNDSKFTDRFFSSTLNLLVSQEKPALDLERLLKPLSFEDISKFQRKILCLQKKNLAIYQEKGRKALFLGVLFLRGYFTNSKGDLCLVNAPLFLIPSDFEKIKNLNLVLKLERKINYNLIYYLQKELNISKSKFTDFLNKLETKKTEQWQDYLFFLNNELQQLLIFSNIKVQFSSSVFSSLAVKDVAEEPKEIVSEVDPFVEIDPKNDKKKDFRAETFVKLTLSDKPKNYQINQLEIVLNFCLTIDSEPNLSLFHDFEQIVQEYSGDNTIHWSNSALSLLRGEIESVLNYSLEKQTVNKNSSLYTPFPSDPSQTRILRIIFDNSTKKVLCIDGPPGTGKSQLICNLLTNALVYQKKVLVICEKEVALKVISDKLSSLGLSGSFLKINELTQTGQIYQEILSNLENIQQEESNENIADINKKIADLENQEVVNFQKIAKYCQVAQEFQNKHQISLQDVYSKFEKEIPLTSTLIQLNSWVENQEQLSKLQEQLKSYTNKFIKIFSKWKLVCLRLKNLFLFESGFPEFEFNLENQNNFREIISDMKQEWQGEKAEINLILRIVKIKLIAQYSQKHRSEILLKAKLQEVKELKNNFQKFFSFWQVESFNDFWQKCSDEEFLLNTQQFIFAEFLTMGELANELSKEGGKNINYLFEKVLVNQEFDYLDNYQKITEQAIYFNWIKKVEEENKETLNNWNYEDLVKIQQEQREITKKKTSLVKSILKIQQKENLARLSTNQTLKKELSKKRKISSLKKLFPELLNYFPIWLSTPEVIASITNFSEPIFDLLVFDEASQIPLEKSIPLWARTKKCIIIGDEQQLPPTDFFQSHLENEDEDWEEEEASEKEEINLGTDDLEKNTSLLNYAKKQTGNQEKLTLLYHYRSRYPELIEFSNQAFYNGILQIVAASELKKTINQPIEYHQVAGRWINNENEIEVRYITNLLKSLSVDKEVGIITFNSKQRDLLIDSIEQGGKNNNLFVKSLEEVQGDERDIIIFSIGYAPNKEGKMILNFGPLSQEGGEKRLNVVISRAREKLIIVTSLLPHDLQRITDYDQNRKLGPKLFKKYLEYAYYSSQGEQEKTQEILEKSLPKITNFSLWKKNTELGEFGSLFEEQVYQELVKKDYQQYEVHKQVKSIGYHLDLAVWSKKLQQYVLGVECDGEYWHGKLENIERDIYRQQILEDRGWKIMRILSRDWCRNKVGEIERISRELGKIDNC